MAEPGTGANRKQIREYAILEYYKIIEMLAARAASDLAAALARDLSPTGSANAVRMRQAETAEAVAVCLRKGTPPFSNTPDVTEPVSHAEKGGSLTMRQLLLIGAALRGARRIKSFLSSDMPENVHGVRRAAEGLSVCPALESRISSDILSESEMADGASPQLRGIRRGMEAQSGKIREWLSRFVVSGSSESVLQDRLVTMRNGRFVLPVKQEQAGKVPGIVHDRSAGGATVFIEPQAVVDMNNRLRELQLEEEAEIERILAEISAEAGAAAGDIRENQRLLAYLDFIFAKANLALDMKALPPERSSGAVEIEQGRNPLIPADAVVPVSIRFGGDEADANRILVVTGPNTGGKTVTLKTVGLFLLMAQAGLQIPAARAALPIVRRVFADIGDDQSIECSLSTFSSHMGNIVEIVGEADADSIVLLDELGAGTDPTEGSALAISVLEELRARGCLVLATTHYTELKKYAIATDGVENASMEFDVETLSPTYRLLMGNPGRSNAFEISQKLGLGKTVIDRARNYLDAETIAFDDVMAEIERDRKSAAADREDAARLRAGAEADERAAAERLQATERQREQILEKARAEAEESVREALAYADSVSAELKELIREARARGVADGAGAGYGRADGYAEWASDATADGGGSGRGRGKAERDAANWQGAGPADAGDLTRRVNEGRKKLRGKQIGQRKSVAGDRDGVGAAPKGVQPAGAGKSGGAATLAAGDAVVIAGTDLKGEVLSAPDGRGKVTVLAGAVKMTLSAGALRKIGGSAPGAPGGFSGAGDSVLTKRPRARGRNLPEQDGSRYAKIVMSKMDNTGSSIDLHGKSLDEAEMLVDKYLDDAVLARYHEVQINHGRGNGILRDGIRRLLKRHRHVAKFRSGHFDEGGDGVTIVTLSNK